jgi:hypothetical protein
VLDIKMMFPGWPAWTHFLIAMRDILMGCSRLMRRIL